MSRPVFPGAIDGREWHSHRRYPGVDHGCDWDADHGSHARAEPGKCFPHAHRGGEGHLIDIHADCGITFKAKSQ